MLNIPKTNVNWHDENFIENSSEFLKSSTDELLTETKSFTIICTTFHGQVNQLKEVLISNQQAIS